MNNMRLFPAMRYQLSYMARGALITLGILCAVFFALGLIMVINDVTEGAINIGVISVNGNVSFHFNSGAVMAITIFIFGIVGIREDLKLFLQHGIGRYTTYFSSLFSSLIIGVALGLLLELLNLAAALWSAFSAQTPAFSVGGFISGWLLHTGGLFFAWHFGALISLIYYRLQKIQQIIFSVAGVAILVFALPRALSRFFGEDSTALERALRSITATPLSLVCLIFFIGAFAAAANFLLLRRAQVKE